MKLPKFVGCRLVSLRAWLFKDRPRLRRAFAFYRNYRRRIWLSVFALFHLLGFISSIDAVMQTRTSQGAIAWAISLNTFPYAAVPAYWVFGHNDFEEYADARREIAYAEGAKQVGLPKVGGDDPIIASGDQKGRKTLEAIAGFPAVTGNRVELLKDGEQIFDSMCEAIDAAKEYVLVQFYIIHDDATGQRLSECLRDCAARGVRVHLLYDNFGSLKTAASYFDAMIETGIEVASFRAERDGLVDFEVNYRNHRKMVVVDGDIAFIGGMNIGDEYLSLDEEIGYWRDTHTKVTGSVVPYLQSHFASDWRWAAGESLEGLRWEPQVFDSADRVATVLAIGTGPDDELERCSLMFQAAINSAAERLWISTPYFAPDHAVTSSLTLAAMRGVDVRILIPEEGDSLAAHYASFSYLPRMEKAGVKVYRYTKGNLHQKAVLVDSELAIIGSANFDNRSFRLNFEEVIAVWDDAEFISDFSKMLEEDFSEAVLADGADMDEAAFHFRLKSRLFRLLAPLN